MRSLAAQLVALALAVPVSCGLEQPSAQHPRSRSPQDDDRRPHQRAHLQRVLRGAHAAPRAASACTAAPSRWRAGRRCPCRRRRASAGAAPSLRVQLVHQAHVLGRYRAQARRPLRLRLARFQAWVCIHRHEAAWNDGGDPYWGGLQMDRGFMRAYGGDMIRRHHGGLADTWTPAEQIVVAERAYATRGFAPWPNTARSCGVL